MTWSDSSHSPQASARITPQTHERPPKTSQQIVRLLSCPLRTFRAMERCDTNGLAVYGGRAMTWARVMFAVANPDRVDSAVLDKVVRLTVALGAELDLFCCADGSLVTQPQRLGSFEVEQEVGERIERRQQELEHRAQGLRKQGLQVRSSVTWDYPLHEGIVRQVLR